MDCWRFPGWGGSVKKTARSIPNSPGISKNGSGKMWGKEILALSLACREKSPSGNVWEGFSGDFTPLGCRNLPNVSSAAQRG